MATGAPVTYEVTAIVPDTQFTASNTVITGKKITFTMSSGYEGTVFVPDTVFSDISAVRALVEGEVKVIAAAQSISGSVS